jgi:hypothetical protein
VAAKRSARSAHRTEVNRNIRIAVEQFDQPELAEEYWDFLCECDDEDCQQWVKLTLREYEALLRAEEPVLATGHERSRGERARRSARQLVDEAHALHAQADVQQKRAGRNSSRSE